VLAQLDERLADAGFPVVRYSDDFAPLAARRDEAWEAMRVASDAGKQVVVLRRLARRGSAEVVAEAVRAVFTTLLCQVGTDLPPWAWACGLGSGRTRQSLLCPARA